MMLAFLGTGVTKGQMFIMLEREATEDLFCPVYYSGLRLERRHYSIGETSSSYFFSCHTKGYLSVSSGFDTWQRTAIEHAAGLHLILSFHNGIMFLLFLSAFWKRRQKAARIVQYSSQWQR